MNTANKDVDQEALDEDARLEAAMAAEDREHGADQPIEASDEPAEDEPATEQATEAAAEPEAPKEPAEPAKVVGVLSKDGTTVLPYGALKGARREAAMNRERAERAERELADLKAGKATAPAAESSELTPEEIEELAADFPQLRKLATVVAKVSKSAPAPAAAEAVDESGEEGSNPIQDAIDTVPLLAAWQAEDPDKWEHAKAIDRSLQASPKWSSKPIAERFAHVARLVAAEYDIPTEAAAPAPPATPTKARKDPDEVVKEAARNAPNTLSDFKGGSADPTRENLDRMPATRALHRVENMSDAQIDAWLAKVG